MNSKTVTNHWSLAPVEGPTGLAIDLSTKRLFAGCDKFLAVVDATNGKVVGKVPIGDGCDGVGFDNEQKTIFASCGEGKLTVIHEDEGDKYSVITNFPTKRGARTVAVNSTLHTIYLPTADFG